MQETHVPARIARVCLLIGLMAAVWILSSPNVPAQSGSGFVSPDSILATARILSGETGLGPPNRMASRPSTGVYADYLRDRLHAVLSPLGGRAYLEAFDSGLPDSTASPMRLQYTNVIGELPGVLPSAGTFVLGAHWDATSEREGSLDSTWSPLTAVAPGADDNGSGVAAILEALRVAAARGIQPQAEILVVFFDGEERQFAPDPGPGKFVHTGGLLLGSTHLADSLSQAGKNILGVVNADMLAFNPRQDSLVVVTNIGSRWLADQILGVEAGSAWTQDLLLARLDKGLASSDHAAFWRRGYDAVLLSEAEDVESHNPHYHRASDTVDATYSRGGAQAAQAAGLIAGLLESWSWTEADSAARFLLSTEDVLVQDAISVDLPLAQVGEAVTVDIGFTNRGGTYTGTWDLSLILEDLDGHLLRTLGSQSGADPVPAGGRVKVRFPWLSTDSERGAVRLVVHLSTENETLDVGRVFAVSGAPVEVPRAFVYPNPTRDPASAVARYELTLGGAVRLSVLDMTGALLAERDEIFDPVFPDDAVDPGLAEVPLSRILNGTELAPGLYFLRVEAFDPDGEGTAVAISRFVVFR